MTPYCGSPFRIAAVTAVSIAANICQYRCHYILYQLKSKRSDDGDSAKPRYSLPRGFLFDYVCCPHYFLEIVFYLAIWQSLPQSLTCLLIALWTISNLSVVAYQHYYFYLATFPEAFIYGDKKNWRILIPGVWWLVTYFLFWKKKKSFSLKNKFDLSIITLWCANT